MPGKRSSTPDSVIRRLLAAYGRTYAQEAGIHIAQNHPAALFQLLCMSLLLSARISANNAMRATKALLNAGLTTPQKMAAATWQERVDVITWHGYKRYDERTATMLGQTAELVLDRYHGDLRKLRAAAEGEVRTAKRLLKEFKGIGDVGADIFLREIQGVWDEVYPYADRRVLEEARRLHLGADAPAIARLVSRADYVRLVAALVRVSLDKPHKEAPLVAQFSL